MLFLNFIMQFSGTNSDNLEELKAELLHFVAQILKGYIWQRQPFCLHIFPGPQTPPWLQKSRSSPPSNDFEALFTSTAAFAAPPAHSSFLWGSVNFGDNIEDEWFITWLLLELTRNFSVTARIWDNDGDFILIEAAYVLPRWLKPEIALNRVWLHNGRVHLIPLISSAAAKKSTATYPAEWGKDELTPAHGLHAVQNFSAVTAVAGQAINGALAPRISAFPGKIKELMHSAVALVPARLAHVLCRLPQSVAAAVETFYFRDPYDARAARKMSYFPPKDLVRTSVRFSRCLFAQIALQDFAPSKNWPEVPMPSHPDYPTAILGLKLAAGYEMLLSKGEDVVIYHHHGSVISDVLKVLKEEIHFEKLKTASARCPPSENDSWLYQAPQIMETELQRREEEVRSHEQQKQQNRTSGGGTRKGPQQAQHGESDDEFDPSQLSSKMKEFMEASAHWEGAEVAEGESIGEDIGGGVDFDEKKFVAELQRIFGSGLGGGGKTKKRGGRGGVYGEDEYGVDSSSEEGSSFYSDGSEDSETEAEDVEENYLLKNFKWETATATDSDDADEEENNFEESYDAVLAQQLKDTSIAQTFATAESLGNAEEGKTESQARAAAARLAAAVKNKEEKEDEEEDISLLPIDVDANLVANLLASYQEQAGLPGPASNLAGLLGINLPDNLPDRPK